MEDKNYITILGWMVNKLNLSGNDLLCYALIYGFSQDNQSSFTGSRKYIAKILGFKSLNSVDLLLKKLLEKQLIIKDSQCINNVVFNSYKANMEHPIFKKSDTPSKNEYPASKNEYDINSNIDNKKEKDKSFSTKSEKDELFEQCWKAYRRKGSKAKAKTFWDKKSDEDKQNILQHINAYVSTRDLQYQKDFERYLKDEIYSTIVYKGNVVVYDPSIGESKEYTPICEGQLMWNSHIKNYLYIGYDTDSIADGYKDETRPDGATIVLHNGRGIIVWSKSEKSWILKK
jgi:hypothetical protein